MFFADPQTIARHNLTQHLTDRLAGDDELAELYSAAGLDSEPTLSARELAATAAVAVLLAFERGQTIADDTLDQLEHTPPKAKPKRKPHRTKRTDPKAPAGPAATLLQCPHCAQTRKTQAALDKHISRAHPAQPE